MKAKPSKTIGIVGGAGPEAGALLTKKIIGVCQKEYGCVSDRDFPKIILISTPFSQMLKPGSFFQKEAKVASELSASLNFLEKGGADLLCIACNTLHAFLEKNDQKKKLVDLTKAAEPYLRETSGKTLVLCTSTSVEKRVYEFPLAIYPNRKEQELVDKTIDRVLSGKYSANDGVRIKALIALKKSADPTIQKVLLGCTEFSVLFDKFPINLNGITIVDPIDLVTKKICQLTFKESKYVRSNL